MQRSLAAVANMQRWKPAVAAADERSICINCTIFQDTDSPQTTVRETQFGYSNTEETLLLHSLKGYAQHSINQHNKCFIMVSERHLVTKTILRSSPVYQAVNPWLGHGQALGAHFGILFWTRTTLVRGSPIGFNIMLCWKHSMYETLVVEPTKRDNCFDQALQMGYLPAGLNLT